MIPKVILELLKIIYIFLTSVYADNRKLDIKFLYKDNNRKPICRLNLDARNKQLLIPDANKKFERIYIDSLNDLYKYKNRLIEVVKRYM